MVGKTGAVLLILAASLLTGIGSAFGEDAKAEEGKIEAGKPRYVAKKGNAWARRGRIVGLAKSAPAFKAQAVNASGKVLSTSAAEKSKGGKRVYEIWLKPGVYTLRITAEDYKTLEIKELEVRARNDLRVDLEFTPAE